MCVCLSPSVTFFILFLIQTLSSRNLSHNTQCTENWIWSIFSTKISTFSFSTLIHLVHEWVHCLPIISNRFRIRTDYFGLVKYNDDAVAFLLFILSSLLSITYGSKTQPPYPQQWPQWRSRLFARAACLRTCKSTQRGTPSSICTIQHGS